MIPYCYMVSVLIRRFHDRNKKWNWVVLLLLPVIGPLWILVECGFLAGTKGRNDYGEDLLV